MRVIAGTYRSRKLQTLHGLALRPSSDRLRETLFNILGPSVQGSIFVDAFAGSGAVGIEALSRGARQVIFIENHSAGVRLLRRNLESLGVTVSTRIAQSVSRAMPGDGTTVTHFPSAAELVALDFQGALERLSGRRMRADFVFADPPYADSSAYESVLELLGEGELLGKDGRAIVEHSRRRILAAIAGNLERIRVVQQGDSALSFYRMVRAA